jgi:hypothetical protein
MKTVFTPVSHAGMSALGLGRVKTALAMSPLTACPIHPGSSNQSQRLPNIGALTIERWVHRAELRQRHLLS